MNLSAIYGTMRSLEVEGETAGRRDVCHVRPVLGPNFHSDPCHVSQMTLLSNWSFRLSSLSSTSEVLLRRMLKSNHFRAALAHGYHCRSL